MNRTRRALYEPTPEAAAKVVAEQIGVKGKAGGWIYDRHDRPMYHGWQAYAKALTSQGVIREKTVTDLRTRKPVIRYAINWRRLRRP